MTEVQWQIPPSVLRLLARAPSDRAVVVLLGTASVTTCRLSPLARDHVAQHLDRRYLCIAANHARQALLRLEDRMSCSRRVQIGHPPNPPSIQATRPGPTTGYVAATWHLARGTLSRPPRRLPVTVR